jgi:FtsZ-binding cell division protein ZapB
MAQPSSVVELTARLVERLKQIQVETTDFPESDRRAAFRSTLRDELGEASKDVSGQVLEGIRTQFVTEARDRDQRLVELEEQVRRLSEERDSLQQVGERLSQENEELRGGSPSGGGGELEILRGALRQMIQGQDVSAESVGLPASQQRLLSLFQEVLRFARDYEMAVNLLLAEALKVGPGGGMDTMMIKGLKQEVRKRFEACLDNEEGSIEALQELLTRNRSFVVDLHRAYDASLSEGIKSLLGALEPQPILDESKGLIGYDYEKAWKAFARSHGDLADLSKADLWERFLFEPFQRRLSGYVSKER